MLKLLIFALACLLPFTQSQCCTKFVAGTKKCSECPAGTHLFRGSCLIDADNCDTYVDGFDCGKCKTGFSVSNGACVTGAPSGSGGSTTNSDVTETYDDANTNDNLAILADYSRSIQKDLETANILFALIRRFKNGTEYSVVQYETTAKKYYEAVA